MIHNYNKLFQIFRNHYIESIFLEETAFNNDKIFNYKFELKMKL